MRFLIFVCAFLALSGHLRAGEQYRVLVLHSYHVGLAWTDAVQHGIDEVVRESGLDLGLHVEYMDALRFRTRLPQIRADLRQALRTKLGDRRPDAIIVVDNDAFDFALAERELLGAEVPLIFAGINGLAAYPLASYRRVTGVAEEASFADTLAVIERLVPGRRLLVIGDQSTTFRGNLDSLRRANQQRANPAPIDVFDDPALAAIEARVSRAGTDTAVFFMSRPSDAQGGPVPIARAVRAVTTASRQPVFSAWDFMLGHGIVGGRLISGDAQGRAAARQLVAILGGTPVEAIPVVWDSPNRYLFDYAALARFGLQDAPLPEGATLIGRPVSFYAANRATVLGTLAVFAVLLAILARLVVEIVRRRRTEAQLALQATHDVLTGLSNRSLLRDRFGQALALATRNNRALALMFLDLDHFKEINDSLGHSIGDALLQAVARRLCASVRESDSVGRLGGDEFVILLNQLDEATEAVAVAEKIAAAMQEPFDVAGNALTISFSIGISAYPWDGQDFDSLLKNADIAMYQAKRDGRNDFRFFSESMNVEIQRRLRVHQQLAGAHGRGEMALHVQPQQSLADGSIVGAEALLRWRSPLLGNVSPAEFIPVAESSGLIIPLGAWVFEEACRIASTWAAAHYPAIPLAVNVSVAQLRRADFCDFVRDTLQRYAVAPTRIEIEITESVFIDGMPSIVDNLRGLEAMGVLLAIDDFGTGYSNLAYLKQTAADRLKIDRSFVKDILNEQNSSEIVRAVIQIGRSLGMKTIAEGVEEQAQADFLRALGCDAMQGYLLSPAVPVDEFSVFFERFDARHQLTAVAGVGPAAVAADRGAGRNAGARAGDPP